MQSFQNNSTHQKGNNSNPITSKLYDNLSEYFFSYYKEKSFQDGLNELIILQKLLLIISFIDFKDEKEIIIASKLFKRLFNTSTNQQQINFGNQEMHQVTQVLLWWSENIKEHQNLKIIVQVYLAISKSLLQNNTIPPNIQYNVQERNVMIKLLKYLNDEKFGYSNFQVLQICERISFQIELQILSQLLNRTLSSVQTLSQESLTIEKLQLIKVQNSDFTEVELNTQNEAKYIMKIEKHKFLLSIFKKMNQSQILNQYLKLIQLKYKLKLLPSLFEFELLSDEINCSNVITLCISGFLTNDEEKKQKWKSILDIQPGTIIALNWNCGDLSDFSSFLSDVKKIAQNTQSTFTKFFSIVGTCLLENPFQKTHDEAELVGYVFGLLISEFNIFGGKQLNIICHSLGSVIVQKCIEQLDIHINYLKRKFINKIIIMGGVVDINALKLLKWSSVQNRIFNFISKKDQILEKLLKYQRFFEKPCGLNIIDSDLVCNYDLTERIQSHSDYFNHLECILELANIEYQNY